MWTFSVVLTQDFSSRGEGIGPDVHPAPHPLGFHLVIFSVLHAPRVALQQAREEGLRADEKEVRIYWKSFS